jgi:hypothetical protein
VAGWPLPYGRSNKLKLIEAYLVEWPRDRIVGQDCDPPSREPFDASRNPHLASDPVPGSSVS